jgi:hypothetical protein
MRILLAPMVLNMAKRRLMKLHAGILRQIALRVISAVNPLMPPSAELLAPSGDTES